MLKVHVAQTVVAVLLLSLEIVAGFITFSELAVLLCKCTSFQTEFQGCIVKTMHRRSVSHFEGVLKVHFA